MTKHRALRVAAILFVALLSIQAAAAPPRWLTGEPLRKHLEQPLKISWKYVPLREALATLAESQRVAIVLDRRVDPSQKLELTIDNLSLTTTFQSIAQRMKLGFAQLGPVAYFGPTEQAAKLRTLAALRREEVSKAPLAVRAALVKSAPMKWEELATPRDLLKSLGDEAKLEVDAEKAIEHDLWAAADLPAMPWIDRLTLVAHQFDFTFELPKDDRQVKLVPIPEKVSIERSYPVGTQASGLANKWKEKYPASKFVAAGTQLTVTGPLEDHEMVESSIKGKPMSRTKVTPGTQVYNLDVKNASLQKVLAQLAQQLGKKIDLDQASLKAAGVAPDKPITVNVKNVTLDELLTAVVKPAGLTFTRNDDGIVVRGK